MKKIEVEGHRGFCAIYPENTLLSFEKAMKIGVDRIEFDIWLSKDKVPVIMHDKNPLRTCGVEGDLREMTLEEIKQLNPCYADRFADLFDGQVEVPTLRELLELKKKLRPDMKLGVEIKDFREETVDRVMELLNEYGVFEQCRFYAFNGKVLRYIKEKYQGTTLGYFDFQMLEFDGYDCYDRIGLWREIAACEDRFLNRMCEYYESLGLIPQVFGVGTEEHVRYCIRKGTDTITVNDPRVAMRVIKEYEENAYV
ncbi:MAG: hypothetical protein IJZ85_13375 [Lachnospiraceae bacterium]|nr:hypothetical protein [Lachnospiraceae bacterium]